MTLPRGWELILVVIVIVLLFGAKRMPDAARGLGRSLRIFKAETKGLAEDGTETPAATTADAPAELPAKPETPAPKAQDPAPSERSEN